MTKIKINSNDIESALKNFGLLPGDTLYLRANIGKIGRINGKSPIQIIEIIQDLLGPEGTLIVPAFTKYGKAWKKPLEPMNRDTATNTGALGSTLLKNASAIRSNHPTHSLVGIGKNAARILQGHDLFTACFLPLKPMMEMGARMMLIGCLKESPGFSTVHLAQYELGLSQKHWIRFLLSASWTDASGQTKSAIPTEAPGCSYGFGNFYKNYLEQAKLRVGLVGNASSLAIDMKTAYDIEHKILAENPKYALCNDASCISCRALNGYNLSAMPLALVLQVLKRIKLG